MIEFVLFITFIIGLGCGYFVPRGKELQLKEDLSKAYDDIYRHNNREWKEQHLQAELKMVRTVYKRGFESIRETLKFYGEPMNYNVSAICDDPIKVDLCLSSAILERGEKAREELKRLEQLIGK